MIISLLLCLHFENILRNCSLAFQIAEEQLGIPRLLDVEDVVLHAQPDRLSILTYVAQFYHKFLVSSTDSGISSPVQSPGSSDSEADRGAVSSLMSSRRSRSVSKSGRRAASPPIEKPNPFREQIKLSKVSNQPNKSTPDRRSACEPVVLRKKSVKGHARSRLTQSMFVDSNKDFALSEVACQSSSSSLSGIEAPKPYISIAHSPSTPLLSKVKEDFERRRKRSRSQPVLLRNEHKFQFLATKIEPRINTKGIHKESKETISVRRSTVNPGATQNVKNVTPENTNRTAKVNQEPRRDSDDRGVISFQKSCQISYPKPFLQTLV